MPEKRTSKDPMEQPDFNPGTLVAGMAIDLKLVLAFIIVAVVFIYVPYLNQSFVRMVVGIMIALFIPGYSLIAALFPGKSDLGRMERGALALGLSIAVSSLMGLGLNYTPWGIRLDSLVVCLSAFSVICVLIANLRRHLMPEGEGLSMTVTSLSDTVKADIFKGAESRLDRNLSMALVAVVVISIGLTIFVLSVPRQGEVFTEFYILSSNDRSDNYPVTYVLGETKQIIVGAVNHESRDVTYDLKVTLSDDTNLTTLYVNNMTLGNEQQWERKINLTPDRIGTLMRVDFQLYANGQMSAPYRDLHLWVNVTGMGT